MLPLDETCFLTYLSLFSLSCAACLRAAIQKGDVMHHTEDIVQKFITIKYLNLCSRWFYILVFDPSHQIAKEDQPIYTRVWCIILEQ